MFPNLKNLSVTYNKLKQRFDLQLKNLVKLDLSNNFL